MLCSKCKYPEVAYTAEKKDLTARCNACGNERKLDTTHKAGKEMMKTIPSFYKANPEFRGKTGGTVQSAQEKAVSDATKIKKASKKKKNQEETEESKQKLTDEILATGGEVNVLDAVLLKLDDPEIGKYQTQCAVMITNFVTTYRTLMTIKRSSVLQY